MTQSKLQLLLPPTFNFRENRRRKVNYTTPLLLKAASLRKKWQNYRDSIPLYPASFHGRGIVICGGGPVYFTCAWVNINRLRRIGCKLPIELWHLDHEITQELIEMMGKLNVSCKSINKYGGGELENYALKPFSIIHSSFSEVLFLDADNNCLKDPSYLFEHEDYKKNNAIFWPDFWITEKSNPIWKILNIPKREMQEQESGQILINKEQCWKELNLCLHFNLERKYYYRMLLGDKDTFQLAWIALAKGYHMINTPVGFCGYENKETDLFYSASMIQHGPDGEDLFLHRNIVKWYYTPPDLRVWKYIIRYKRDGQDRRIIWKNSGGMTYLNLLGDTEKIAASTTILDLEEECMRVLQELRVSPPFLKFLYLNKSDS